MAEIKRQYFNPKLSGAYSGLSTFFANRKFHKTKKEVENELLKDPAYYFYRPAKKIIKHRRKVVVHLPNFQLVIDLIDTQRYSKENAGYRYILIAIDAFSRKMYAIPLKNKTGTVLVGAMKHIFKQMVRIPRYIQSDDGTEFTNKELQAFLRKKGIIWFSTFSIIKVPYYPSIM
jgi:transposase InsO family protein